MVARIQSKNIPASVSNTAGTFVCNHVLYGVRHLVETKYTGKRSGFIHIPFLPQQVIDKKGQPSMSLDTIVAALTAAESKLIADEFVSAPTMPDAMSVEKRQNAHAKKANVIENHDTFS